MEELLVFSGKALIVVVSFAIIVIIITVASLKKGSKTEFEVEPLHEKWLDLKTFMQSPILEKKELKKIQKENKKKEKEKEKNQDKDKQEVNVYVINFEGNVHADSVQNLREEVTAVLQIAKPIDEIVVKVESPGGVVHGYGLAASQLNRIREKGLRLTVCVDKVAASGGYMMAAVANKIVAAPFAIIGSIGVVAQVPNFYKLLKKNDIDYKEYTAGDFKRTVSLLGEITEKGEQKFIEQLENTHQLFKDFVSQLRPQLNLKDVATGEYWFGLDALKKGLIDEISTSDDYLLKNFEQNKVFQIKYEKKKSLAEKMSERLSLIFQQTLKNTLEYLERKFYN